MPAPPTAPAKKKAVQIAIFQLEAHGVEQRVASIVTDMLPGEMSKMKEAPFARI